jgi:predicted phosphodiesterase
MSVRTLVLGDLHVSSHTPPEVSHDLTRLLEAHRAARVIFAGDFFDLSADPGMTVRGALEAHPEVARALDEHVDRGGQLVWLAGNHDHGISTELQRRARVHTTPWFFRDGGLHVEHGHLYDPDNAPPHPLASPRGTLGVHFVEHFIAKTGAFAYLNANDKTPLHLFMSAFRWYGKRGPFVVYRYFRTAFAALAKSGSRYDGARDAERAEAFLEGFLSDAGIDEGTARDLIAERATPTMTSLQNTVARLYLDRVAATVTLLAGLSAFAIGKRRLGLALGALGLGGLAWSWSRGHDRYGGTVPARLDEAATRIARASGASLVVFGHAHEIADRDGYSNTASFAFPRGAPGRPFLEIEGPREAPHAVRRFFRQEDGAKIST